MKIELVVLRNNDDGKSKVLETFQECLENSNYEISSIKQTMENMQNAMTLHFAQSSVNSMTKVSPSGHGISDMTELKVVRK